MSIPPPPFSVHPYPILSSRIYSTPILPSPILTSPIPPRPLSFSIVPSPPSFGPLLPPPVFPGGPQAVRAPEEAPSPRQETGEQVLNHWPPRSSLSNAPSNSSGTPHRRRGRNMAATPHYYMCVRTAGSTKYGTFTLREGLVLWVYSMVRVWDLLRAQASNSRPATQTQADA